MQARITTRDIKVPCSRVCCLPLVMSHRELFPGRFTSNEASLAFLMTHCWALAPVSSKIYYIKRIKLFSSH